MDDGDDDGDGKVSSSPTFLSTLQCLLRKNSEKKWMITSDDDDEECVSSSFRFS